MRCNDHYSGVFIAFSCYAMILDLYREYYVSRKNALITMDGTLIDLFLRGLLIRRVRFSQV